MGNIISNLFEMLGPLWTSSKSFPILQTTAMSQLSMISMKYDKFFIFSKFIVANESTKEIREKKQS